MPPVRVLTIIESLGRGGAENLVLSVHRRLDRERVEPRVASLFGPDPLATELEASDVPVERMRLSRPAGALRGVLGLRRIIRRHRIDVVHTHLYYANVTGRLAAAGLAGVVTTLHNPDYGREDPGTTVFRVKKAVDRWTGKGLTDTILAVSEAVRRDYETHLGFRDIRILHNGIDLERFAEALEQVDRAAERRALGLVAEEALLLHVGRLHPQKGLDVLIDALARPPASELRWTLALVGVGPAEASLRKRAASRGLGDRVRFLGTVARPERFYAAADLFVFPSRYEAFGIALLEAMAAGLPPVASRVDGIPELTGDAGALLVPPEDPDALSRAIAGLLDDPDRRRTLGSAARKRSALFDVCRVARELEDVYAEVAGRRGAA